MTKVLETNFRHVNIALVNEMAVLCHDLGVDFWDVIRCAETKPFGFQPFRPGPGVGGHGVPVDPGGPPHGGRTSGSPLRMVSLAQEINDRMPRYVIQRCATLLNEHGKSVRGARVLLLGVTYKPDTADQEAAPCPGDRHPADGHGRPDRLPRPAQSWTGGSANAPSRAPTRCTRRRPPPI